jgi:hypothetical protein
VFLDKHRTTDSIQKHNIFADGVSLEHTRTGCDRFQNFTTIKDIILKYILKLEDNIKVDGRKMNKEYMNLIG